MGGEMQRGYDDTRYLGEMAAGLVTRRYQKVDEAAKAVLGEDGGSNVDRLRRKFREQNWYEKGLSDYMEAEIASRNLIPEPAYHRHVRRFLDRLSAPLQTISAARAAIMGKVKVRPPGTMVSVSVVATALLAAASSGMVDVNSVLLFAIIFTVATLVAWADKTSEVVTGRTAGIHLAGLGVLTAVIVAVFGHFDRSAEFTIGSSQGALATAIGLTVMGVYATSFIGSRTRRTGTRDTIEIGGLIAAIALLSQTGTALLLLDTSSVAHVAQAFSVN
ncbi:hypothetical protein G6L37_00315 [Agrobacterium rubi]|nr:hypothetical protein [Agrobacterium rubi]NTF23832.1 hypothetical protein [Agrobacterium rubi]